MQFCYVFEFGQVVLVCPSFLHGDQRQYLVPADFLVVEILLMPTNGSQRAGFFLCLFWTCNICGDIS